VIVIRPRSGMEVMGLTGYEDADARRAHLSIVGTFSILLPCDYGAKVLSGSIHLLFSSAAIIIRVE
jgi:hypothetical protein